MIFPIRRLERGRRLFVARYWCSWLVAARSTTFEINDRLKTGSLIVSRQSVTADQQSCLLFCGSHQYFVRRICISWSVGVCFWRWRFPVWTALLQHPCSILTEEPLFPDSGYTLSTAQDIQNVDEYETSNCQDSGSLSHRRGATSSRHTYCVCFLADRTFWITLTFV